METLFNKAKLLWRKTILFKTSDYLISLYFRKKLHNQDFTILCSNCVGGTIYHRLGKRFTSPTINLSMSQADFIEYCLRLDEYSKEKLQFKKSDEYYPIATLGGEGLPEITIHFIHYLNEDEAEKKWTERTKRINKDRLYIILYNAAPLDEIKKLDNVKCCNKVIFSHTPIKEIAWSFQMKPNILFGKDRTFLAQNLLGLRYYERKWDFVGFINHIPYSQ